MKGVVALKFELSKHLFFHVQYELNYIYRILEIFRLKNHIFVKYATYMTVLISQKLQF